MAESKKVEVSNAVLGPSESMAQFVIRQLLEGLTVKVTVGDKTYDGYVHQLDLAKGAKHVFAWVHLEEPELGMYEGVGGFPSIKVAIMLDGTVRVLPPEVQDDV